jgi:hypothetical protein
MSLRIARRVRARITKQELEFDSTVRTTPRVEAIAENLSMHGHICFY